MDDRETESCSKKLGQFLFQKPYDILNLFTWTEPKYIDIMNIVDNIDDWFRKLRGGCSSVG